MMVVVIITTYYRYSRDSSNNFTIQYYGRSTNQITLNSTALTNVRNSSNYVDNIGSSQTISGQMICGFGEATGNSSQFSIEFAMKPQALLMQLVHLKVMLYQQQIVLQLVRQVQL